MKTMMLVAAALLVAGCGADKKKPRKLTTVECREYRCTSGGNLTKTVTDPKECGENIDKSGIYSYAGPSYCARSLSDWLKKHAGAELVEIVPITQDTAFEASGTHYNKGTRKLLVVYRK